MTELKAAWCPVRKLPGRSRDKAGNLMPGWVIEQRRPTNAITRMITRQLARWAHFSQLRSSSGSQRAFKGHYFFRLSLQQTTARPGTAAPSPDCPSSTAAPPTQTRPTYRAASGAFWFFFWFSGCWRALAKGTARAGCFYRAVLLATAPDAYACTSRAARGRCCWPPKLN